MVEVVRTIFAPIFLDFDNFLSHWRTNRSATYDNFENYSILWKGLFFRKKRCKRRLNQPRNADAMSCGSNSTTPQSGRWPTSVIFKKTEKHSISSSRADVRQAISTKFCAVIEVVRAIILGQNFFGSSP